MVKTVEMIYGVLMLISVCLYQVDAATCRCQAQRMCAQPGSCQFLCQAGYAGESCQYDNVGYRAPSNRFKLLDGNYRSCMSSRRFTVRFTSSINIDTIRIHRPYSVSDRSLIYLYAGTRQIKIRRLSDFSSRQHGQITTLQFSVVQNVTSAQIRQLSRACEVEFSYERNPNACTDSKCTGRGKCVLDDGNAVCLCEPGYTGQHCETECDDGRYGLYCNNTCNNGCASTTCNKTSGQCDCKPGYIGATCNEQCPIGTFGLNCAGNCSNGCHNTCDFIRGSCTCKDGYIGNTCDAECPSGTYGSNCSKNCSQGCNNTCNPVNGNCSCKPGYEGKKCQAECPNGTFGLNCAGNCSNGCNNTCDFIRGSCTCKDGYVGNTCDAECPSGTYGSNCSKNCSQGCNNTCNPANGNCSCKPGYGGKKCQAASSMTVSDSATDVTEQKTPSSLVASSTTLKALTMTVSDSATDVTEQKTPSSVVASSTTLKASTMTVSDSATDVTEQKTPSSVVASSTTLKALTMTLSDSATDVTEQKTPSSLVALSTTLKASTMTVSDSATDVTEQKTPSSVVASSTTLKDLVSDDRYIDSSSGEIIFFTCPRGFYGPGCADYCSKGCQNGTCHHVNGNCICKDGWTGEKCSEQCASGTYGPDCAYSCSKGCKKGKCHRVNGNCNCKDGWRGIRCSERCRKGTYGENCSFSCSSGCQYDMCNITTGECLYCKSGWTHHITTRPRCDKQCLSGFYGHGCADSCSEGCERGTCHHVTGNCSCKDGWTGEKCKSQCGTGKYGVDCKRICHRGCKDGRCNRVDGNCTCIPGWMGSKCNMTATTTESDSETDVTEPTKPWSVGTSSTTVKRCSPGNYGYRCKSVCSEGCVQETCDPVDGSCGSRCKDGWSGVSCSIRLTYCNATVKTTNETVFNIQKTVVGETFYTTEICHIDGRPLGEIQCMADGKGGGSWGNFTTNPGCDYSDLNESRISNDLKNLVEGNLTSENVKGVIQTVVNVTQNTSLTELDVLYITDILEKTTNLSEIKRQVAEDVLTMYDNVLNTPEKDLRKAHSRAKVANRILQTVDNIMTKVEPGPSGKGVITTDTFVSQVWNLRNENVKEIPLGLQLSEAASSGNETSSSLFNDTIDISQTDSALFLPEDFMKNVVNDSNNKDIRLSMNLFKNTALFSNSQGSSKNSFLLNSKVIAAKIIVDGKEQTDLKGGKVTMIFLPTQVGADTRCAYWNFTLGTWSTDGCHYSERKSGRDVCECDHLTNFAVLLNMDGQSDHNSVHELPLSVITILGLSLSIIGLSGTVLSFLLFKKLREKHPQQTLFNLALAELCSWIVFLAGITQTRDPVGCTLVAILLHYFILASFMWMLAEAFLHYLLLVKVHAQSSYTSRYMLKTGIPAWTLPLVPVIIVLAVDPDLYRGSDTHCWMSLSASLYAFALPVGLVILCNIIIYIMVVVNICRISKVGVKRSESERKMALLNIRVPVMCFILFGLSWLFGFLAVADAKAVFQYIFCITSSTQGFLIFVFFTARNKQVRDSWRNLFCKKKEESGRRLFKSKEMSTAATTTNITEANTSTIT